MHDSAYSVLFFFFHFPEQKNKMCVCAALDVLFSSSIISPALLSSCLFSAPCRSSDVDSTALAAQRFSKSFVFPWCFLCVHRKREGGGIEKPVADDISFKWFRVSSSSSLPLNFDGHLLDESVWRHAFELPIFRRIIQVGHWWYKSCRPWTWISAIMLYTYFILCICIYSPLCVVMYVTRAAIWISSARPMANVWCHPFTFLSSYDSSYIATFHNTSIKTRFWNINLGWPLIDISTPYTIYILLSATIYSVNAISLRNERAWITFMNLAWFSFFLNASYKQFEWTPPLSFACSTPPPPFFFNGE